MRASSTEDPSRCIATELASTTASFVSPPKRMPTIEEQETDRASFGDQLMRKCAMVRQTRPSDWRRLLKITRKFLGLNRSPKGKGYAFFLSDDDKR